MARSLVEKRDGRVTRAEKQRRERRETVVAGALRAFARHGYHAASIADILAEARLSRASFYLYFESKRAILDELIERFLDHLKEAVREVDISPGATPPVEQVHEIVRQVFAALLEERDLTALLINEGRGIDSDFDRKLEDFYGRIKLLIASALGHGQRLGLVRACDIDLASTCIMGTVKELLADLIARAGAGHPPELDRVVREVVDFNLNGVFRSQGKPGR